MRNYNGMRLMRRRPNSDFWSRVDRSGGPDACWLWTALRSKKGYGRVFRDGREVGAHRMAYELTFGPTDAEAVRHTCDNPPCCNPSHLIPGTHAENVRDCVAKGRQVHVRGERHGLRLHPERAAHGERNGASKMSEDRVREVLLRLPSESRRVIAESVGINRRTVDRIANRQIWKHVSNALTCGTTTGCG
jgi:hypothetical protein